MESSAKIPFLRIWGVLKKNFQLVFGNLYLLFHWCQWLFPFQQLDACCLNFLTGTKRGRSKDPFGPIPSYYLSTVLSLKPRLFKAKLLVFSLILIRALLDFKKNRNVVKSERCKMDDLQISEEITTSCISKTPIQLTFRIHRSKLRLLVHQDKTIFKSHNLWKFIEEGYMLPS